MTIAPPRKRPKRVAKKIKRRSGLMTHGLQHARDVRHLVSILEENAVPPGMCPRCGVEFHLYFPHKDPITPPEGMACNSCEPHEGALAPIIERALDQLAGAGIFEGGAAND